MYFQERKRLSCKANIMGLLNDSDIWKVVSYLQAESDQERLDALKEEDLGDRKNAIYHEGLAIGYENSADYVQSKLLWAIDAELNKKAERG